MGDTLLVQGGAALARTYEYNRRGQRTAARTTVIVSSGTLAAEPAAQTPYYCDGTTARLDSVASAFAVVRTVTRSDWPAPRRP